MIYASAVHMAIGLSNPFDLGPGERWNAIHTTIGGWSR
jgi:hypothetical protein